MGLKGKILSLFTWKKKKPEATVHDFHNRLHSYLLFGSKDQGKVMGAICNVRKDEMPKVGDILREKNMDGVFLWGISSIDNYGQQGLMSCGDKKIGFALQVEGPLEEVE